MSNSNYGQSTSTNCIGPYVGGIGQWSGIVENKRSEARKRYDRLSAILAQHGTDDDFQAASATLRSVVSDIVGRL